MKKLFFPCLFVTVLLITGTGDAVAQEGQFKLGGGLLFGSEVESVGIQGNGTYRFTEEIAGAADISIFFPDEDFDWWAINGNGHYIFEADEEFHVYGLAGLNITTVSAGSFSNTELGLNLGAGGELHLGSVSLYGEVKYVVSDADQLVLGAGVRVPVN